MTIRPASGARSPRPARAGLSRNQSLQTLALVFAIGAFHLATLRDGHDWGADFAQYVQHARNLVNHHPYADTGYVYNPETAATGPRAYPPVFPLLLAPIVAATQPELNLVAMKAEVVACLLLAMLAIERVLRPVAPFHHRMGTLALLGFNPWLWDFKDQVLSDIPFLAAVYATLLTMQRLEDPDLPRRRQWLLAAVTGVLAFVATEIRTVGIVLLPALGLLEVIRRRRIPATLLIAGAVYAVGFVAISRWLPPEGSYLDQLRRDPLVAARNVSVYLRALSVVWTNGSWMAPRVVLTVITLALAICEWWSRMWRSPTVLETFTIPYLGIVLIWPSEQGTRFLLPLLPLYFAYTLLALERLGSKLGEGARKAPLVAFLAMACATYAWRYHTVDFGPTQGGVAAPDARELFRFLRVSTAPSDVIAFRKARAVSLYTGRSAVVPHNAPDAELAAYLRSVGVKWVIDGLDEENRVTGLVTRHPEWFEPAFENPTFRVYRFKTP